jgi:hypothetical protein
VDFAGAGSELASSRKRRISKCKLKSRSGFPVSKPRTTLNPAPGKSWSSTSFWAELLRGLWRKDIRDLEVLRPEVDSGGYDLAIEHRGLIRHVQLKSSHRDAKRAAVTANVKLLDRHSACILWIYFDPDTLLLGPFLWFGGAPGEKIPPLGKKVARHTKHNANREKGLRIGHRVIAKSCFDRLETIDAVTQKLIGR